MKKLYTVIAVMLLVLFFFGCSQFIEDHQCCVKEKQEEKDLEKAFADTSKKLGPANNLVQLSIANLNSKARDLLAEINLYITRATTQQRLNLLMQDIREYNEAIGRINGDLDALIATIRKKWTAKDALDVATVDKWACIRANCPPIDTCCPAEKKAYHRADLAWQHQKIKIQDISAYLGTIRGIHSKAKSDKMAADALYLKECGVSNAAVCNDAKGRVNFNDFLTQITARVNSAMADSAGLQKALLALEADAARTKTAMDSCVAHCQK